MTESLGSEADGFAAASAGELKAIVQTVARAKGALVADGPALDLDSMRVIDFVLSLEEAAAIEIPNAVLTEENFRTVDSVAELLSRLRAR